MASRPKVPPEVRGSLAVLWVAKLAPVFEREVVEKMIKEEVWIEGAEFMKTLLDSEADRASFLEACWTQELEEVQTVSEAQKQKQQRVFDL